jgi:hypothetical protein
MYNIYAGVYGDKLDISFDQAAKTELEIDVDLRALWMTSGLTAASSGLSTAVVDSLAALPNAYGNFTLGGAQAAAKSFKLTINRNLEAKECLNGYSGPVSMIPGIPTYDLEAVFYFDSDSIMRQFWGQVGSTGTYSPVINANTYSIEAAIALPRNTTSGIANIFGAYFPTTSITSVSRGNLDAKGAVTQTVKFKPIYSLGLGASAKLYLTNSRANTSIVTAGTPITGVTGGNVFPYSN